MFGLFLVHTFTKSELIERDCFVLRNGLKAFCFARFCSLVFITSSCAGIFAAIRLDEILSAHFSIKLNESIKLMTKFSTSFDIGFAADVGCLVNYSAKPIFLPAICSTEKLNGRSLSTHLVNLL